MTQPPKPASRPDKVSLWRYAKLFRQDILSAQPARLYRAWMAEFKTPFFRSYLINQPDLIKTVLKERPNDFPKSDRIGEGLRPLLGNSVFLTNGETWKRQRRIIDPAFEGGRLRDTFPAMWDAAEAAVKRLAPHAGEVIEIEALETSGIVGSAIRNLKLPTGAIIGAILRDGVVTIPRAEDVIRSHDRVVVFALESVVKRVERIFAVRLEYF